MEMTIEKMHPDLLKHIYPTLQRWYCDISTFGLIFHFYMIWGRRDEICARLNRWISVLFVSMEDFACQYLKNRDGSSVKVLAVSTQDLADTGAVWLVSIGSPKRSVTRHPQYYSTKTYIVTSDLSFFQLKHCKLPGCENVVISNRFGHYCSDECNVQFVSQCFRAFVNHRPTSAKQAWCSNSWFSIAISNRQDWPGPTGPVIIPA